MTGSNNTYTGGTQLNGGTLLLSSSNANALRNSVVTVSAGSLAFAAGATSPAVGGLSGSGGITLQDANSNPVMLYVGGNGASSNFAGNLSGPGGLVKAGSGLFALSASQSYLGATVVNGGTLQLAPPGSFGGNGAGWTFRKSGGNSTLGVSNNVLTLTASTVGSTASGLMV